MTHNDSALPQGANTPVFNATSLSPSSDEAGADRRRAGLRRLLARKKLTPSELARLIGLPTANALFNHLGGRSTALSLETIERMVNLFPDVSFAELVGLAPGQPAQERWREVEPASVLVTVEAAAGVWRSHYELPSDQWTAVALPSNTAADPDSLFAVRVQLPGAEYLYPANTILVCRHIPMPAGRLANGARCVVRQSRRTRIEVTVRELQHVNGQAWLWLRSTDPSHQQPLRLSAADDLALAETDTSASVEITGVVVSSWQPEHDSRHA